MLRPAWPQRARFAAAVWMGVLLFSWSAVSGAASFPASKHESNGISVGRPKLFDNRTLQIMLEQLNQQLETVRVVDQQKLIDSLLKQQGAEVTDVSRTLLLTTPVQPKVETKEAAGEDGALAPSERTTTEELPAPAAPGLPELIAAPTYTPTFGPNSADLLFDQVSLSYQIFNVRMLLERSLTDRLWDEEPRLQAVLGFQVSLDPPKRFRDHAAFVEVTVTSASGKTDLVALMPFEKTYNSSALSNRSNDFGGSAVARVLTLGYRERRRQQHFYLFRDADTLALEDLRNPNTVGTTFGWTFRPVLGRRSVTAGVRQMFAVVSMPAPDGEQKQEALQVTVRTYWRSYHRSTLTTRSAGERDVMTWNSPAELAIYSSSFVEKRLRPEIKKVDWWVTDTNSAVVTITGKNFFPGTRVLIGSTVYDSPANGLVLKSDRTLELRTTARELASGDAVLSGRYGGPARLELGSGEPQQKGILIRRLSARPERGRAYIPLEIELQDRAGGDLSLVAANKPLLIIGDRFIPGPYREQRIPCEVPFEGKAVQRTCLHLEALVPGDLLEKDTLIKIRFPFLGSDWADARPLNRENKSFQVFNLGGENEVSLAIQGPGFTEKWTVQLDKTYTQADSSLRMIRPTMMLLRINKTLLDNYKRLILIPEKGTPTVLDIPAVTPPAPVPSLDSGQAKPQAVKGSSPSVEFKGKNLGAIQKAWFEGKELSVKASPDGTSITVFLSREVTKDLGPAIVMLESSGGTRIPAELEIIANP